MINIFGDPRSLTIFVFHGTVGSWPYGTLQAVGNGDGTVSIVNRSRRGSSGETFFEIARVAFDDLVDENSDPHGVDEPSTVNTLNALFTSGGIAAPTITSPSSVPASTTVPVNFQLEGTGIVGIEWSALPDGLAVCSLNRRRIVGTATTPGSYPVTVTATNAAGTATATITFDVSLGYTNTKSVLFLNNDYAAADAAVVAPILGRAANGAGAGDAWSLSVWYKPSTSNSQTQSVMFFGGADPDVDGGLWLLYNGANAGRQQLVVRYGTTTEHVELTSPVGTLVPGAWTHIFLVYDGGTTGNDPGSVADYYSRFSLYVDGALVALSGANAGSGWSGGVPGEVFEINRFDGGDYGRGSNLEEIAIFDGDQTAQLATIYNAGSPPDMNTLTTPPDHWWRMGDDPGDVFPTLDDVNGAAPFTLFNMTVADIVSDVP